MFRPLAWLQPTNYAILQVLNMGTDPDENLGLSDMINTFSDFTGGFLYPHMEAAAGIGLEATGNDRWIGNRYGPLRTPEEALQSLLPQASLMSNLTGSSEGMAGLIIESDLPGFKLTPQQHQDAMYMLMEMVDAGDLSAEQGQRSAKMLMDGMADEWNKKAVSKALSRDLPFTLAQYHGLPITAYTPGWERSVRIQNQLNEGVSEDMDRLYMPHFYSELEKTQPSMSLRKMIPPAALSPSLKTEWRQTTNYWHGVDMAQAERLAFQDQLDLALANGEIDGTQWVDLRKQAFQRYGGKIELLAGENPKANITADQSKIFQQRLGSQESPVHPYRAAVNGYFEIELKEGFPADYIGLAEQRQTYLSKLDAETAEYVKWYVTKNMTPSEVAYKEAVETMQPYWKIERTVMEKRGLTELYMSVRNDQAAENELRKTHPQYKAACAEVSKLRKLIRLAYPDIAAASEKYWGLSSLL